MSARWFTFCLTVLATAALVLKCVAATNAAPAPSQPMTPPFPSPVSPVDQFRKLLAMTASQREKALDAKRPDIRERFRSKLAEYEAIGPEEREARLRATELRWYLLPLLSTPPSNRPSNLDYIPETIRPLVEIRLRRWDMLPIPLGKELLDNQEAVQFLTQPGTVTMEDQGRLLAMMTPERRAFLEAGIGRINALSDVERRQLFDRFNDFLDLSLQEQSKMFGALSEAERKQMEKTLEAYTKLSGTQRRQCLTAFDKFSGMSIAERHQFLKNAEKWASMSANERAQWRELVRKIPDWPPMPPPRVPSPPLPSAPTKRNPATVVTNGK